jgi:hypothetical protein
VTAPVTAIAEAVRAALDLASGPDDPEAQRLLAASRARRRDLRSEANRDRAVVELAGRYHQAVAMARHARRPKARSRFEAVARTALHGLLRLAVDEDELDQVHDQVAEDIGRA